MATVSVIVPNYNHGQFLRQRMETILAQTYRDFELILLDDASTDGSQEILREYISREVNPPRQAGSSPPKVRIEFNEVNSGSPYPQWGKGVRMSSGKYIWIAESDDYADERLLERLVGVLESDPRIAFAYCRSRVVEEDGRDADFADRYAPHDNPERWMVDYVADGREECATYFTYDNIVANTSSAVFRRSAWDAAGGVDETMRTSGDWKLWAAMALTGKVAYVSEPLNYYRKHGQTVRSQVSAARVICEELTVVRWIIDRVTPSKAALAKAGRVASPRWVPVVLSGRTPPELRREILKSARVLDPHPYRWALRPAVAAVGRKIWRHWRDLRSGFVRR
jgi:glycosyltransferase involved in cell wall biosynthesis